MYDGRLQPHEQKESLMAVKRKSARKPMRKVARKPVRKVTAKRAAAPKSKTVSPVPAGFTTVTPYLVVKGAGDAIEWYKKAFGAVEKKRHLTPDGRVMYAMLTIGNTPVQLCDEFEMMQHWRSPASVGGTTVGMHLYVKDVDSAYNRAVAAGARILFPLMDTFWGDRYGSMIDPYGHAWSIASHKKDLTDAQIMEGARAFFSSKGPEQHQA
jgi:uncharacterized glyoxalase superfamily protein PhnB